MREWQTKYEATEHKEQFHTTVAIGEEGIEHLVLVRVVGKGDGRLGCKVTMSMKQNDKYDRQETDTINLREIELVGGNAPKPVVNVADHECGKVNAIKVMKG